MSIGFASTGTPCGARCGADVETTTSSADSDGSRRIWESSSSPVITGIIRSTMTRHGRSVASRPRASAPLRAPAAVQPIISTASQSVSRTSSSSSTTSTQQPRLFLFAPLMGHAVG